jgi:hypothetical protein
MQIPSPRKFSARFAWVFGIAGVLPAPVSLIGGRVVQLIVHMADRCVARISHLVDYNDVARRIWPLASGVQFSLSLLLVSVLSAWATDGRPVLPCFRVMYHRSKQRPKIRYMYNAA